MAKLGCGNRPPLPPKINDDELVAHNSKLIIRIVSRLMDCIASICGWRKRKNGISIDGTLLVVSPVSPLMALAGKAQD
ncbi:hypothetical protein JHK86_022388 [Glycine max]|nr:hypothetical protein JHK86_022388 [Glycine max]